MFSYGSTSFFREQEMNKTIRKLEWKGDMNERREERYCIVNFWSHVLEQKFVIQEGVRL